MHDTDTIGATKPAVSDQRTHMHGMWSRVAGSWGEHAVYTDHRSAQETSVLVDLAQLAPGHQVLELACGAGGLGLAAALRIGPQGTVLLSDVAPEMVAIARKLARAQQLTVASTAVLDLEDIDQPDGHFDAVLCRHGLQFCTDPVRAAREMNRVLRPGGHVALSVWGDRERNPWLGVVLDVVAAELGRPVPPAGMPGPFAISSAGELAGVLEAGGLGGVEVSEVPVPTEAVSFDVWWRRTCDLAGPLTAILAGLQPPVAASIRQRALDATAAYRNGSSIEFPGVALIASGQRS